MFGIGGANNSEIGVYISIKNTSAQAVRIVGLSLLIPYKSVSPYERLTYWIRFRRFRYVGWMHMTPAFNEINTNLPVTVKPYHAHNVFVPEGVMRRALEGYSDVKFAIQVQDALRRGRTSKPFVMPTRFVPKN